MNPKPADGVVLDAQGMTETRRALAQLAIVLGTLVVLATLPYVVSPLSRFRVWKPGDPAPFATLFRGWEAQAHTPAAETFETEAQTARRLGEELGSTVAANFGEIEVPDTGDSTPAVQIAPDEYAGIEIEIEDEGGRAMAAFYDALKRTADREPHELTRIAHYGDSSIATDLLTVTVRRRMQKRFGDGGHGFILVSRGNMPYLHRDVIHRASEGWELRQIVANQDRDGLFGFGGVQFRAGGGPSATFATDPEAPVGRTVSRFEIFFQRHEAGGLLRYAVDGGESHEVSTRGALGDGFERIDVPDGEHSLSIRAAGSGQLRLYGVVLEREGPGVVYDSIGMVGARARRMLNFDAAHVRSQLDHRDTNLLVLGFGGNEASDPARDANLLENEYVQVIQRMRAGREGMSCLVFAPLDQAQRDEGGSAATLPLLPIIVHAQRAAARREGCAFYDTWSAMGGEGAMGRWLRSRPRLAMGDLRHATPAGYEVLGNMFYKALLKGFADHLARTGG